MKGRTNNPAGRPKGIPNKTTGQLRESITQFIEDNFEEVEKDWRKLNPKDKLNFYRDLIQYVIPKMQSADITNHNDLTVKDVTDKLIRRLQLDPDDLDL